MRRLLPLFIIVSLVMPACSEANPVEPAVQLPIASPTATATPSLFQSPVVSDTPTPTSVTELDTSFAITPTESLTVTPTLTPTLTTSSISTRTAPPTRPLLLSTLPPEKPLNLYRDKRGKGDQPCG
jgi:hypothetical protein